MMNYEDTERELAELFREVKYIEGTFPPVYLVDGVLIVYDKLEKIKVIAGENLTMQSDQKSKTLWYWLRQLAGKPSPGYNISNHK